MLIYNYLKMSFKKAELYTLKKEFADAEKIYREIFKLKNKNLNRKDRI